MLSCSACAMTFLSFDKCRLTCCPRTCSLRWHAVIAKETAAPRSNVVAPSYCLTTDASRITISLRTNNNRQRFATRTMLGPTLLDGTIRGRSMTFQEYAVLVCAVGTGVLFGAALKGATRLLSGYGFLFVGVSRTGLTFARLLVFGIALPKLNRSLYRR